MKGGPLCLEFMGRYGCIGSYLRRLCRGDVSVYSGTHSSSWIAEGVEALAWASLPSCWLTFCSNICARLCLFHCCGSMLGSHAPRFSLVRKRCRHSGLCQLSIVEAITRPLWKSSRYIRWIGLCSVSGLVSTNNAARDHGGRLVPIPLRVKFSGAGAVETSCQCPSCMNKTL